MKMLMLWVSLVSTVGSSGWLAASELLSPVLAALLPELLSGLPPHAPSKVNSMSRASVSASNFFDIWFSSFIFSLNLSFNPAQGNT